MLLETGGFRNSLEAYSQPVPPVTLFVQAMTELELRRLVLPVKMSPIASSGVRVLCYILMLNRISVSRICNRSLQALQIELVEIIWVLVNRILPKSEWIQVFP